MSKLPNDIIEGLKRHFPHVLPILIREQTQKSFYKFFRTFWDTVAPKTPGHFNWHVRYLCDQLQLLAERVFNNEARLHDLIINVPPGSTKTTICSIMFPAWVFTRMPSARIICASVSNDLAERFSSKTRDLLNSELYRTCFPFVKLARRTKTRLWTTEGGERQSFGVMSNVTGQHAHFIVIDDPINPAMALSDRNRNTANEWMDSIISTRRIITDKLLTPTVLIMQRLHQEDPTGYWLAKQGDDGTVKHICLPAEEDSTAGIKPAGLQKYYKNGLLDPVRFNYAFLEEQKKKLGEFNYACQYHQIPISRNNKFFDVEQIQCKIAPPLDVFAQLCRFWDKASSVGKGDYTAGVLMGRTPNQDFWVLDIVRGRWNSFEREAVIRQTAEYDGEDVLIGLEKERSSGGLDSRNMTIRNLAGFTVKSASINGTKEQRADSFSTQVNAGNVYCRVAPWNKEYLEELQYFPFGIHDDQVDASAGAFKFVLEYKPAQVVCSEFSFV